MAPSASIPPTPQPRPPSPSILSVCAAAPTTTPGKTCDSPSTRRAIRNILRAGLFRAPCRELGHVIFRHQRAVTGAQHAFEQHFDRKGQAGYIPKTCLLQVFQTKHGGPPAGGVKRRAGTKSIVDA